MTLIWLALCWSLTIIIQKEQKDMNWSVKFTDDQTFKSMFNTSYETVMCTHVLSSLNNKLKNDYVFFSILKHHWYNIFMNYINSLSLSIFMSITYKYVLIFIDHFIKMKHLVFITFMKVEEVINCFYAYV